jgi:flavin-dependent dehydrogenase
VSPPSGSRDVVVIGGGPAGSTAACLLAKRGHDVLLLERDHFPRFHIGESLLPANVPIFKRLGVLDQLHLEAVYKPGALFVFGDRVMEANFSRGDPRAFFASTPFSFMVERAWFDDVLLRNTAKNGAEVREGVRVDEVVEENGRVRGVRGVAEDGGAFEVGARIVLDCSGRGALLATRRGVRRTNVLGRMATFAHFRGEMRHPRLREGWFLGQVVHDGWIWLIPLAGGVISVGAVLSLERFRAAESSPETFLKTQLRSTRFLRDAVGEDLVQVGSTYTLGNLGYTSDRLWGPGWLLAGDAAFFIDPLFSSGVYLAMLSGERSAEVIADGLEAGRFSDEPFEDYQREFRGHEQAVLRAVDAFYVASRSPLCTSIAPAANNRWSGPKLATFLGGDFGRHRGMVSLTRHVARAIARVA